MTDYKDPLKDPIAWRSDTTFTVVALLQHRPASRPVISAVKLAKTHDDAQGEIKRMIDVVTECLTSDSFLAPQRSVTIAMVIALLWLLQRLVFRRRKEILDRVMRGPVPSCADFIKAL